MVKESITLSMELDKTQCYEFECFEDNYPLTSSTQGCRIGQCKTKTADCGLRTADCGPGVKCRLSVKCRLQTESKTQAGVKCRPSINCSRGRV